MVVISTKRKKKKRDLHGQASSAAGIARGLTLGSLVSKRVTASDPAKSFKMFWEGVLSMMVIHERHAAGMEAPGGPKAPTLDVPFDDWLWSNDTDGEGKKHTAATAEGIRNEDMQAMEAKRLLNPKGRLKVFWDVLVAMVVLYSIVDVPLRIGFYSDVPLDPSSWGIGVFVCIVFSADIALTFNTAYVDPAKDVLVTDRSAIALTYVRFWFLIDVITTIPFDLIPSARTDLAYIRILRLMRIFRVMKITKLISTSGLKTFLEAGYLSPQVLSLLGLFFQVFLIGHYWACLWRFVGTPLVTGVPEITYQEHVDGKPFVTRTWLTDFDYIYDTVGAQYTASIYFSFATLLTVGYGDIHPVNLSERLVSIFMMLCGSMLFGNIIAKLKEVIDSRNLMNREKKESMEELGEYLEEKTIPAGLKLAAKDAYWFYLCRRTSLAEEGLFTILPAALRLRLLSQKYAKEIDSIDCFRTGDLAFVADLVEKAVPFMALRGEMVYHSNDIASEVCFIVRGRIRIRYADGYDGSKERIVGFATQGNYFGEQEFYKRSPRVASYEAVQTASLLSLDYAHLGEAIEAHPVAGAKFLGEIRRRFEMWTKMVASAEVGVALTKVSGGETTSPMLLRSISVLASSQKKEKSPAKTPTNKTAAPCTTTTHTLFVNGDATRYSSEEMLVLTATDTSATTAAKQDLYASIKYPMIDTDATGHEVLFEATAQSVRARGVLHPKDEVKVRWDMFLGALIVYSLVTVPLNLAFDAYVGSPEFDYAVDVFFFLDVVITFFTAYYSVNRDAYILDRRRIAFNYLSFWFAIDMVSCLPIDTFVISATNGTGGNFAAIQLIKTLRLVRLAKLLRIADFTKYKNYVEVYFGVHPGIFSFLMVISGIAIAGHFLASFWWGTSADLSTYAWLDDPAMVYDPLRDAPFYQQYWTSLYWAITTLTATGYGDIVPENTRERVVATFIFVIGASVFGYTTAAVAVIFASFNRREANLNERTNLVLEFLKDTRCPSTVQNDVIGHMRQVIKHTSLYDEDAILRRLPFRIRNALMAVQHKDIVANMPIFRFIKSKSVQLHVLKLIHHAVANTGQTIVKEGDKCTAIVFLVKGNALMSKVTKLGEEHFWNVEREKRRKEAEDMSTSRVGGSRKTQQQPQPQPQPKNTVPSAEGATKGHQQVAYRWRPNTPEESVRAQALWAIVRQNLPVIADTEGRKQRGGSATFIKNIMGKVRSAIEEEEAAERIERLRFEQEKIEQRKRNKVWWRRGRIGRAYDAVERGIEYVTPQNFDQPHPEEKLGMDLLYDEVWSQYRILVGDLAPGQFIGHEEILRCDPFPCSVVATEPSIYYSLRRSDVLQLVTEYPSIAVDIQAGLGHAIQEAEKRTIESEATKAKIAFLNEIKKRFATSERDKLRSKWTRENTASKFTFLELVAYAVAMRGGKKGANKVHVQTEQSDPQAQTQAQIPAAVATPAKDPQTSAQANATTPASAARAQQSRRRRSHSDILALRRKKPQTTPRRPSIDGQHPTRIGL